MNPARWPAILRTATPFWIVGALSALILLAVSAFCAAQTSGAAKDPRPESESPPVQSRETGKSAKAEEKSPREKVAEDAAILASTADQIRDELKKAHLTVFPLDVVEKTRAVESLVKKIKGEAIAR